MNEGVQGRYHLHKPRSLPSCGRFWTASVWGDPKGRKGNCSRTLSGGYWSFVGRNSRATGQVLKLSFCVWKGLDHLLMWLWMGERMVIVSRGSRRGIPQGVILVCFLHFISESALFTLGIHSTADCIW